MQALYDYILESVTKFDKYTDDFDNLCDTNTKLTANKDKSLVAQFIEDVISEANYKPKELFIYAEGATYFKIPYAFGEAIISCVLNSKYNDKLRYTESGKKIKVYFKESKGVIFETGSGSIGRVSTSHQETATCLVWNAYVNTMNNEMFDIKDTELIRNIVSDLTSDFDSEWISTFSKQVECLVTYLKSIGEDPLNYKLCRYNDDSEIGKSYAKYINAYTKEIGGQKDNFDPADVIAYKYGDVGYIKGKLNSYCNNPVESKENYIKDLFNTHYIIGISLKKVAGNKSAKYDVYNTGSSNKCESVTSFNVKSTDTQVTVECTGNFNFDDVTDGDGKEIGTEKVVKLVMRSFGSGQVGVDCSIKEIKGKQSPTLGKCPVRIWEDVISLTNKKDLTSCVKSFVNFLSDEKHRSVVITGLENMIKGAIKEGPACFPFVLIH